jgi:hypothetical protein
MLAPDPQLGYHRIVMHDNRTRRLLQGQPAALS